MSDRFDTFTDGAKQGQALLEAGAGGRGELAPPTAPPGTQEAGRRARRPASAAATAWWAQRHRIRTAPPRSGDRRGTWPSPPGACTEETGDAAPALTSPRARPGGAGGPNRAAYERRGRQPA